MKRSLLVMVIAFSAINMAAQDTLFVYGPGGPLGPMEECGKLFSKKTGIAVKVIAGPTANWIEQARSNADVFFGGAEYMLTQLSLQQKGLVDSSTRISLYKRGAGILVRKGNPKNIRSLKDLTRPGIGLIDVNGAGQFGMWEDLAGRQDLIAGIRKNILQSFENTGLAVEAWKSDKRYDAWIIFSSWHYRLKEHSDLVRIPAGMNVYRGTPVALSTITDQPADALRFINFLKTGEAHKIFIKWGWERVNK